MIVFLNGEYVDDSQATIPIHDRGFLFADGVFESARLHRGRFFRLPEHLARLRTSGTIFGLAPPPDEELAGVAAELVRRNALGEASLRITLTRGPGDGTAGTCLVTLQPLADDWFDRAARGWSACIARTRRPAADAVPPALKTTGRPHAILARREAARAGADDAILLSAEGFLAEGPTWNLFWRRGDTLFTPAVDVGILAGITRALVLSLAPQLGLAVEEGAFRADALSGADEIFASLTSLGVVSITSVDGSTLPSPRPTATALQQRYWELVAEECRGE
jgi:branched-chain amino acid aminotransferase